LLPESAAALANINSGVPLANMLSVCGFLVVFLLEKVFFMPEEEQRIPIIYILWITILEEEITADHHRSHPRPSHPRPTPHTIAPSSPAVIPVSTASDVEIEILPTLPENATSTAEMTTESIQDVSTTPQLRSRKERIERELSHEHGTSRLLSQPSSGQSTAQQLLPYVLMIVLSIHSIIAGLTLGVQGTVGTLTPLFVAIIR
jgi:hypothetical protein